MSMGFHIVSNHTQHCNGSRTLNSINGEPSSLQWITRIKWNPFDVMRYFRRIEHHNPANVPFNNCGHISQLNSLGYCGVNCQLGVFIMKEVQYMLAKWKLDKLYLIILHPGIQTSSTVIAMWVGMDWPQPMLRGTNQCKRSVCGCMIHLVSVCSQ